jgi:hypothetical protein
MTDKYIQPKGQWGKERKEVDTEKVNALWLEGYTYPEIAQLLQVGRMHMWRYRKTRGGTNPRTLADKITHLTNREKLRYEGKIPFKSGE